MLYQICKFFFFFWKFLDDIQEPTANKSNEEMQKLKESYDQILQNQKFIFDKLKDLEENKCSKKKVKIEVTPYVKVNVYPLS